MQFGEKKHNSVKMFAQMATGGNNLFLPSLGLYF